VAKWNFVLIDYSIDTSIDLCWVLRVFLEGADNFVDVIIKEKEIIQAVQHALFWSLIPFKHSVPLFSQNEDSRFKFKCAKSFNVLHSSRRKLLSLLQGHAMLNTHVSPGSQEDLSIFSRLTPLPRSSRCALR